MDATALNCMQLFFHFAVFQIIEWQLHGGCTFYQSLDWLATQEKVYKNMLMDEGDCDCKLTG